jgi:hypothetical protein
MGSSICIVLTNIFTKNGLIQSSHTYMLYTKAKTNVDIDQIVIQNV